MIAKNVNQFFKIHLGNYKAAILFSISLTIIQGIVLIPSAFLVKNIFDQSLPKADYRLTLTYIGAIVVLVVIRNIIRYHESINTISVSRKILTRIRKELTAHFLNLNPPDFIQINKAQSHTNLIEHTERVGRMVNTLITNIFPASLMGLFLFAVMIYLEIYLSILLIALIPLTFLLTKRLHKNVKKAVTGYYKSYTGLNRIILFILDHGWLIKIKAVEDKIKVENENLIDRIEFDGYKLNMSHATQKLMMEALVVIAGLVILAFGAYMVIHAQMTLGSLISFYFVLFMLRKEQMTIVNSLPYFMEGIGSISHLQDFLEFKREVFYTGKKKINFTGALCMENLAFGYNDKPLFSSVDFKIKKGEIVSIWGSNGVGKTTLIYLILGFYRPNAGVIRCDDYSYDDIDIKHFRQQIGVVWQDQSLFEGTIKDNILFGNEDRENNLGEALRISLTAEFIKKSGLSLESNVGNNGDHLSSGQKQKVALARAFVGRPKMLILDEPTTHLDQQSIEHFLHNIHQLQDRPTIIMISHDRVVADMGEQKYLLQNSSLLKIPASSFVEV